MKSKFPMHFRNCHKELSNESMMKFYSNANQLYETCPIGLKGTRDISRPVTYNHKNVNKKELFAKLDHRKKNQ